MEGRSIGQAEPAQSIDQSAAQSASTQSNDQSADQTNAQSNDQTNAQSNDQTNDQTNDQSASSAQSSWYASALSLLSLSSPVFSVGIGDGLGDLAMLLSTDLPIVLSPGSSFRRVCARFGLALRPLLLLDCPPSPRTLYVADDWAQILAVLCFAHIDAALQPLPAEPRRRCTPAECRLMALTSDALNAEGGEAMERAILESVEGGATMIQIRDKTEDFGGI